MSAGNGRGRAGTAAENADEFTSYVVVRVDPNGVAPLMELGTAKFASAQE